ncbi:hypothetical protein [Streptomyces sp. NPDC097610]|uniref:hypothetical protein n=1 Tax=Streptomyces sp. NPDC097610 TaxID=3157227 RepID=UPI003318235C
MTWAWLRACGVPDPDRSTPHDARRTTHGSRLTAHGSRLTAALLRDPAALPEALRRGLLDRADAERFLAEGVHLVELSGNPSLPADLVDRLAIDPAEGVRLAVSLRPELTEARRAAIDFTMAIVIDADASGVDRSCRGAPIIADGEANGT